MVETPKRRKNSNQRGAAADRLSDLPESLLIHILSFLPTKDAVATSILSNRWRLLWKSVPTLDLRFDKQDTPDARMRFERFVYRVLLLQTSNPLKKFSFEFYNGHTSWDLITWLTVAMNRSIQEVQISTTQRFRMPLEFKLPRSFFTCKTVVDLKLEGIALTNLPSSIRLPSLKRLCFQDVDFYNYDELRRFLCGCPLLHDLVLNAFKFCLASDDYGHISLPKLRQVTLDFYQEPYDPELVLSEFLGAFQNVQALSMRRSALRTFDDYASEIALPSLLNLTHLELEINSGCLPTSLLTIQRHAINLQCLVIIAEDWDIFRPQNCEQPLNFPECYSSQLTSFWYERFRGLDCELQFVKHILSKSFSMKKVSINSSKVLPLEEKHRILQQLCAFPRVSACELIFDKS